jgi:hypothetical protein
MLELALVELKGRPALVHRRGGDQLAAAIEGVGHQVDRLFGLIFE